MIKSFFFDRNTLQIAILWVLHRIHFNGRGIVDVNWVRIFFLKLFDLSIDLQNPMLFDRKKNPMLYGPYDLRLGYHALIHTSTRISPSAKKLNKDA